MIHYNSTLPNVPPLGVHPSAYSAYEQAINVANNTFTCLDGSNVILYSRLNDNYIDCDDASDEPGTGVVDNSMFYCINEYGTSIQIAGWSVGDGLCDCCDGSDEFFNPHVHCPNSCNQSELTRVALAKQLAALSGDYSHFAGLARGQVGPLLKRIPKQIDSLTSRLTKLQVKADRIEANPVLDIPLPKMPTTKVKWQAVVYRLWSLFIAAPRVTAGISVSPKKLMRQEVQKQLDEIEAEAQKVEGLLNWKADDDECFMTIFMKKYRFGNYTLLFLSEIKNKKVSLATFVDTEGPDTHVYKGAGTTVEMKLVCGDKDAWVKMEPLGKGAYRAVFATPIMCSHELNTRFSEMAIDELRAAALGFRLAV
jgi:hypothetical protein